MLKQDLYVSPNSAIKSPVTTTETNSHLCEETVCLYLRFKRRCKSSARPIVRILWKAVGDRILMAGGLTNLSYPCIPCCIPISAKKITTYRTHHENHEQPRRHLLFAAAKFHAKFRNIPNYRNKKQKLDFSSYSLW